LTGGAEKSGECGYEVTVIGLEQQQIKRGSEGEA